MVRVDMQRSGKERPLQSFGKCFPQTQRINFPCAWDITQDMILGNCQGCEFARTQIANSTDAKTFYPHGLRPWDGEWEEPAWAASSPCEHAAHAGKKQQGSAPHPAGAGRPQTPLVWLTAYKTRRNLGSYDMLLVTFLPSLDAPSMIR